MNRELLLLRHGKSNWNVEADDYDRPLKKRGVRAARHVGKRLYKQNLVPDLIISSPAERAISTAEIVSEAMGVDGQVIQHEKRLYEADLEDLLSVLIELPDGVSRVLLVGHNPGLEELLIFLSEAMITIPEDGKLLPTAALARLVVSCKWAEVAKNCAGLIEVKRPER